MSLLRIADVLSAFSASACRGRGRPGQRPGRVRGTKEGGDPRIISLIPSHTTLSAGGEGLAGTTSVPSIRKCYFIPIYPYGLGTAIMSKTTVRSGMATPATIALEAAGGRFGSKIFERMASNALLEAGSAQ